MILIDLDSNSMERSTLVIGLNLRYLLSSLSMGTFSLVFLDKRLSSRTETSPTKFAGFQYYTEISFNQIDDFDKVKLSARSFTSQNLQDLVD